MDEILALQKQLEALQTQDTSHRLSERNCIEIILKLIEQKKIEVIFTKSGKEYITPSKLQSEINDELLAHGGRVGLVDLQPVLNVDMARIEDACNQIARSASIFILNGELISETYLDGVVEEISQLLEDAGQITVVSMAQKFSLPAQLIRSAIEQRQGGIFTGHLRQNELYTDSFVQRHFHRVRGALLAATKPIPLRHIVNSLQLQDQLTYSQAKELVDGKVVAGSLSGSQDRANYTPLVFAKAQESTVTAFFQDNGYITYETCQKQGISTAKTYLKKKYPDGVCLDTCFVSESVVSNLAAVVEDANTDDSFFNATSHVPPPLSNSDVTALLTKALQEATEHSSGESAHLPPLQLGAYCVSGSLVEKCRQTTLPHLDSLALSTKLAPPSASVPQPKKQVEEDEDEDGGRKGKGKGKQDKKKGASSDEEDEEGSSRDARKAARRKKAQQAGGKERANIGGGQKGKRKDDEEEEEEETKKGGKGQDKKGGGKAQDSKAIEREGRGGGDKQKGPRVPDLAPRFVSDVIAKYLKGRDASKDLVDALSSHLFPALDKYYKQAVVRALEACGEGGSQWKRARAARLQSALQERFDHISLYLNAANALSETPESGGKSAVDDLLNARERQEDEEARVVCTNRLHRHLLRTLCTQTTDILLRYLAIVQYKPHSQDLPKEGKEKEKEKEKKEEKDGRDKARKGGATEDKESEEELSMEPLTPEFRDEVIGSFTGARAKSLKSLLLALTNKNADAFVSQLEIEANLAEIRVTRQDKKKARNAVFALRKALTSQLEKEENPAVILHIATIVLHSKLSGTILHAPTRALPTIINCMRSMENSESGALDALSQLALALGVGRDDQDEEGEDHRGDAGQIAELAGRAKRVVLAKDGSSSLTDK